MLDKIKNPNPWIIAVLIAIGIEVLIAVIGELFNFGFQSYLNQLGYIFAVPFLKITGYEVVQAINDFSGEHPDVTNFTEVAIISGLGLFTIFILGPYLLLKGYIQADQSENTKKRSWTWYVGAILVMGALIPALLGGALSTKVYLNTMKSTDDSRQRDLLRAELMNLALDASYLLFMPQEKGGGEGSFKAIGKDKHVIALNDLDSYDSNSKFEFQIYGEVSDSSFTIVGISENPGRKSDFKNVNGATGRQQIPVKVKPYEETIFRMQSSGMLMN